MNTFGAHNPLRSYRPGIVPDLLDHIAHIRRALSGIQPAGVSA